MPLAQVPILCRTRLPDLDKVSLLYIFCMHASVV